MWRGGEGGVEMVRRREWVFLGGVGLAVIPPIIYEGEGLII